MDTPDETASTVNYHSLSSLSAFYHVDQQIRNQLRLSVNPNNEVLVKQAFQKHVLPVLMGVYWWPKEREQLRRNLQYFLTKGSFGGTDPDDELSRVETVYFDRDPAFNLPDDPMSYYRWAWDVLFPGEDYHLESLDRYIEENRIETA